MEVDHELVALSGEITALAAPGTKHFLEVQQDLREQGFANPTHAEVSRLAREKVLTELGELAAAQQPGN